MTGADWFYIDADKGHARINVKAIAKDDNDVVRGPYMNPSIFDQYMIA